MTNSYSTDNLRTTRNNCDVDGSQVSLCFTAQFQLFTTHGQQRRRRRWRHEYSGPHTGWRQTHAHITTIEPWRTSWTSLQRRTVQKNPAV